LRGRERGAEKRDFKTGSEPEQGRVTLPVNPKRLFQSYVSEIIHLSAQCKRLMTADTSDRYESVGRLFEVGTLVYLFVEMMVLSC
jgi:hypothetical protein